MTVYDTPEKREKRKRQLEQAHIDRLFTIYYERMKKGDRVGAMKIAWILSKDYGIEGDHTFAVGSPQE